MTRSRIILMALPVISGVLMTVAAPSSNLFFLGWVGLIPLFYAMARSRGSGFTPAFLFTLIWNGGLFYWLAMNCGTPVWVAIVTMVALVLLMSLFAGIAGWLARRVILRYRTFGWFFLPVVWVTFETWVCHAGEVAFPWPLLALTQASFSPALQLMEFTGVWGVSLWVLAVNVSLFLLLFGRRRRAKITAAGVLAAAILSVVFAWDHSLIYLDQSQNQQVQVTAVQGNIPPLEKWTQGEELSLNRYDSLSRAAFNPHTALVIWPETSVPAQLEGGLYLRLCYFTDRANVTLVTGVPDYCMFGGHYRHLNGAVQIVPEKGVTARTYKKYLVPFGERVPFQWIYPGLGKLNLGQAEFLPGLRQALFTFTKDSVEVRYPVLICYESLFPELSRQAVRDGANLLVTISNDAWYGWSSEPAQIDALSRFRCIETRRSMARVSNAGISSIIDPMGTELCATGLFQTTFVTAPVPLERRTTFFVVYGEWLPVLMNVITGAALIFMAVRKRKQ